MTTHFWHFCGQRLSTPGLTWIQRWGYREIIIRHVVGCVRLQQSQLHHDSLLRPRLTTKWHREVHQQLLKYE